MKKKKGRKRKGLKELFIPQMHCSKCPAIDLCRFPDIFCLLTVFICLLQLVGLFCSNPCYSVVWESSRLYWTWNSYYKKCHLTFKLIFSHPYFISLSLQPLPLSFQETSAKQIQNRCITKNVLNKPILLWFLGTLVCEKHENVFIFVTA